LKKIFSIMLIIIGLFLILYFGYVFIIFSTSDNPLILPFTAEPILFSLMFSGLGLIVLIIGVVSILKANSEKTNVKKLL